MRFTWLIGIVLAIAATVRADEGVNIEYCNVGGESLLLDYQTPDGDGPFPVAIIIHGGGWGAGDKQADVDALFKPLIDAKIAWASINYRLAPEHRWPACYDDVREAIRVVREHAAEYKGDPKRIALIGYSAGGHLATLAAVQADDETRVQAVVGIAPPTDLVADCARRGGVSPSLMALLDRPKELTDETNKLLRELSPLTYVKPGLPPFLLIHGTEDKSVPYQQSINFQAALKKANVPCELITLQGAPHRIADWPKFDPDYATKMARWLATTLAVSDAGAPTTAPTTQRADAIDISIDAGDVVSRISPFIYGINGADFEKMPYLTFTRQGGNRMTAWNWETNASNAGNDWHHQNDDYLGGGDKPGEVARAFLTPAFARGKTAIVTIPMAGYVSSDKKGDGDVNQTPDYLSKRFVKSLPKKNAPFTDPPDTHDNAVYQDEFVWWLNKQFPKEKRNGGQLFYDLDNEPDLWASTHARIHPEKLTYAELIQRTREYASAIKDVDAQSLIFGFVSYGFAGFRSLQGAPDANDRDFIDFFLDAMRDAEKSSGRRLVDVLDLHWYPEARGGGKRITEPDVDPAAAEARVQAPRSLWDPTYTETSWITDNVLHEPIRLIPRVKAQIEQHYPGTKLAFTEYDYGGVKHISGAIAQADVLGIFGEQGVFAAAYWGSGGDLQHAAFECYRNYDGHGGAYGDTAVRATSGNVHDVSVHASKFADDPSKMTVILINRATGPRTCKVAVKSFPFEKAALYRLGPDKPAVVPAGEVAVARAASFELPAMSITVAVLHRAG
jgi:acetyl esterase/lipase